MFPQDITRVLFNLIPNGFYAATKRKNTIDSEGFQPTAAAVTRSLGIALRSWIRDNEVGTNPFFTTKPAGDVYPLTAVLAAEGPYLIARRAEDAIIFASRSAP